jgi:hypothetical protein
MQGSIQRLEAFYMLRRDRRCNSGTLWATAIDDEMALADVSGLPVLAELPLNGSEHLLDAGANATVHQRRPLPIRVERDAKYFDK